MLIELLINALHATSAGAPVTKDYTLPMGTISKVRIRFPGVTTAVLGVQLRHDSSSFAPHPSAEQWITFDEAAPDKVEWEEEHAITGRAGQLQVAAYNTHASSDFTIHFDIVLEPEFYPRKLLERLNSLSLSIGDFLASVKGEPVSSKPREEPRRR